MNNADYLRTVLWVLEEGSPAQLDERHRVYLTKAGTLQVLDTDTHKKTKLEDCSTSLLSYLSFALKSYNESYLSNDYLKEMESGIAAFTEDGRNFMCSSDSTDVIEIVREYPRKGVLCKLNSYFTFMYRRDTGSIVCPEKFKGIVLKLLWRGMLSVNESGYLDYINERVKYF